MAGEKPRIKVAVKPKEGGGGRISLLAAWDRDGKLSASLDKRVVELAAKLDDGTIVRVKRGADGKPDHWIDVFEEGVPRTGAQASQQQRTYAAKLSDVQPPLDDYGDDPLPF